MRLTENQMQVLQFVANGEYLGWQHMETLNFLERKNLIEEVKTSFRHSVSMRITALGRTTLERNKK